LVDNCISQLQLLGRQILYICSGSGAVKIYYYMWKICCGEPRNLANWPAEFGNICRGKLWSLVMWCDVVVCSGERSEQETSETGGATSSTAGFGRPCQQLRWQWL